MAKQFITAENVSNEEAGAVFSKLCTDVLKQDEASMKEMLGIPVGTPVTTKDLISLIQDSGLEANIVIYYSDDAQKPPIQKEEAPKKEEVKAEENGKAEPAPAGQELPF